MFVSGAGIGCTFPVLGAASVSELPPSSYATRSAINTAARQVGGVVGVATRVAVLGDRPTLSDSRHGWILVLAAVCASTLFSSRIRQRKGNALSTPVPVAAGFGQEPTYDSKFL